MNKSVIFLFLISCSFLSGQNFESRLNLQYNQKLQHKMEVYERTLEMIRENPNSEELDQFYFNLAELSTEIDQQEPEKTVSYYKQVLRYNRNFMYKDIVLYNIGYFSERMIILDNGKQRQWFYEQEIPLPDSLIYSEELFKPAIDYFQRLQEEHPQSSYYDETTWRLSELYYLIAQENNSIATLRRAEENYNKIIAKEESPFYYHCLSGRLWTLYEMGNSEQVFTECMEFLNNFDISRAGSNQVIFTEEIIKIMAIVIIEDDTIDFIDGNIAAARIELKIRSLETEYWKKKILFVIGELLLEDGRPVPAINIFETFLSQYPDTGNAPEIQNAIIETQSKYPQLFGGETAVRKLIKDRYNLIMRSYHPGSEWYEQNRDKDIFKSIAIIRSIIERKEPDLYNSFIRKPSRNIYLEYRELVMTYTGFNTFSSLKSQQAEFSMQRNLVYMSQILAQSTDSPQDYIYAVQALESFNTNYPEHEEHIDFAMNIFYCYEKLYSFNQTDSLFTLPADSLYIAASRQYENILKQSDDWERLQDKLAKVIFKRAEYFFNIDDLEAAEEEYFAVTELRAEAEILSDSWSRLAEIALLNKQFTESESYYRKALEFAEGYSQSRIYDNLLIVIEQKAEYLLDNNDPDLAAAAYLRLSSELQDSYPSRSVRFFTLAIDIYEELGNDLKVSELLSNSRNKPNLDHTIAIYINTWKESDELKDWSRSISLRENFIRNYQGTNEAYRARLQIIDIYENKMIKKNKAAELYLELYEEADQYDLGTDRKENIFLNALRIYQNLNDISRCRELTDNFVQTYPDYSLVDLNLTYNDRDDFKTAVRKLKKLKTNIYNLFKAEHYNEMEKEITNFREIAAVINSDSMQIDLSLENARYDLLLQYSEYYDKLKTQLGKIENVFLLKSARELLPVDSSTMWQENMVAGNDLIGKLKNQCDIFRNEVMALLLEGKSFQLKIPDYTHSIWAIATVYDHAYEVVDQQVRNFVVKSDQLNKPELKKNKYLQSELKRRIIAEGNEYSFPFKLAAAKFYQNLLFNYYDGQNYSDLWTRKSLNRLVEWELRNVSGDIASLNEKLLLSEESYANEVIQQEFDAIFDVYQEKNYVSAQEQFMNFVSSYTGHALTYSALYYAGESSYNMGQFSNAEEIFKQILDFERDKTPDALMRLGHIYNSTGKRKLAYFYWNRLLDEFPDHYLSQIIKLTFDQIKEQEELEEKIASRDISKDRRIVLQYRKYMQSFKEGKFKSARKGFARFNKRYPEHELAYNSLFMQAESYFNLEEYTQALDIYNEVIDLNGGKSPLALYRSGQCYEKTGNPEQRDRYWIKLMTEYPDNFLVKIISNENKALTLRSGTISKTVKTNNVQTRVSTGQITTDTTHLQYKKALIKFRYKIYDEAITMLEEFIINNPEHRLIYNARYLTAEAYKESGNHKKALEEFLSLLPRSGARIPETMLHISEIYLALEDYSNARKYLDNVMINYAGTFQAAQAKKLLNKIP